jgi:hypothetical protein
LICLLAALGCGGSVDADEVVKGIKAKLTLPMTVDDATRLDDIRSVATHDIGYFLTLTATTKADYDAAPFGAKLESAVRATSCTDANYKVLFQAGLSVSVIYQTRDGVEVERMTMAPKDCGF